MVFVPDIVTNLAHYKYQQLTTKGIGSMRAKLTTHHFEPEGQLSFREGVRFQVKVSASRLLGSAIHGIR
jgi:hypothetical protein